MQKRNFSKIIASAAIAGAVSCNNAPADYILVLGTYTDAYAVEGSDTLAKSRGIYSVRFSVADGSMTLVDSVEAENPSYVVIAPDGRHVYAVGESGDNSCVYSIGYDAGRGHFGAVERFDSVGADPCFIAIAGDEVVTADYSGGSVSVFALDDDGKIAKRVRCDRFSGSGPDSLRQASPHIHCAMPSPDGKTMFVSDLGTDCLYRYSVGKDGCVITDTIHLDPGFGPRHIAFSTDGNTCYVIGELSGNVAVIDVGSLLVKQTVICDPLRVRASGDIHLSRDGRFLYASNRRQDDGIRVYSIGSDGRLSDVEYIPTGKHPRNFFVTPCDRYLLVAARDDNRIDVYSRDPDSGRLTFTGKSFVVPRPVCITSR